MWKFQEDSRTRMYSINGELKCEELWAAALLTKSYHIGSVVLAAQLLQNQGSNLGSVCQLRLIGALLHMKSISVTFPPPET